MPTLEDNLRRIFRLCPNNRRLAELGGITEGSVRNWKRGKVPDGGKLRPFAEKLGLRIGQLLGDDPIPEQWWADFANSVVNDKVGQLVTLLKGRNFESLPDAARRSIAEAVTALADAEAEREKPPA